MHTCTHTCIHARTHACTHACNILLEIFSKNKGSYCSFSTTKWSINIHDSTLVQMSSILIWHRRRIVRFEAGTSGFPSWCPTDWWWTGYFWGAASPLLERQTVTLPSSQNLGSLLKVMTPCSKHSWGKSFEVRNYTSIAIYHFTPIPRPSHLWCFAHGHGQTGLHPMLHPSVPCWYVWYFFVTSFRPLDGPKQKTFFFIQTEDSLPWNGCHLWAALGCQSLRCSAWQDHLFLLPLGRASNVHSALTILSASASHIIPSQGLCVQVHEAANCILNPARSVQIRSYSQSAMVWLGNQGTLIFLVFFPYNQHY